ncbi:endospore germination permease [Clostridiaceae bacterium 35-E11]
MQKISISSTQLTILLMGFLFGSSAVLIPGTNASQDAWLAYILGWFGSYVLIGIYVAIALLHPSKALVEILVDVFGKMLGSIISLLYIWYFMHLGALVFRNFGEYMTTVNYPETPLLFITVCFALVLAYALRAGLEVIARTAELMIPLVMLGILFLFFVFIGLYDWNHLFPILGQGWMPVIKESFHVLGFPFGDAVVFLMVFPALNRQKKMLKATYIALTIAGLILLSTVLRSLLILGPQLLVRTVFPLDVSTTLLPDAIIQPFVSVNLIVTGGIKIVICSYAALVGMIQLFRLTDYKPFVLPISALMVSLSIWIFDNLSDMLQWSKEVSPYYGALFEIIIPLLLLGIAVLRRQIKSR